MCKKAILVKDYINNKNIDYRFYIAMLYTSSYNIDEENGNYRMFNVEDFFIHKDEIITKMNISNPTFDKNFNNFLRTELVYVNEKDDEISIKVKENGKKYTLLSEYEFEKLIKMSNNEIKTYLAIKFIIANETNPKYIKLSAISTMIGLSKSSAYKTIPKIVSKLSDEGLIKVSIKETKSFIDGKFIKANAYTFKITSQEN
ncbi:hypothetical protein [Fusobacterium sp.]|uniref:hypothetical protein n=1 Tax=Fusobacterium sp. TaxID=68766 RepID=UPI002610AE87|nr:hypothetical protein [Fusobacterium sp.]